MITSPLREQLLNEFDKLSLEKQRRVLEFTRTLNNTLPPGTPGDTLIELAHELNFSSDDLAQMEAAIEEGCERIDWDGWQ